MKKWLQRKFINLLTRHLFHGLTSEDILSVKAKGVIMLKGKPLSKDRVDKIKHDASMFANSSVWKFIKDSARYQASVMALEKSESKVDTMNAKIMVFLLQEIDSVLKKLSNG